MDVNALLEKIRKFNKDRDWHKFHDNKNLAIALSIESSELLELFLWDRDKHVNLDDLSDELADILIYALQLADKNKLDIESIIEYKLNKNSEKYPVVRSKGISNKYNDFD